MRFWIAGGCSFLALVAVALVVWFSGAGCSSTDGWSGATTAEYTPKPRVAVQLYVWMQDRGRRHIDFWEDLDAVLAEVRASGASAIEGWLDWFDSDERAERATRLLAKHNLSLAGAYSGGTLHDAQKAQETIGTIVRRAKRAREVGRIYIDVNPDPLPAKARKTDEQLATQVRMINQLGFALSDLGMQLVIHQHDPEILHGAREHRYNVEHLNPAAVGLCLDTHWVYRGGEDPLTLLKEAGMKVKVIHLRNSHDGVWMESFGPGDVDYLPIAAYLRETGFDGWLVLELAHEGKTRLTRPLVENARIGREYLESVFLKTDKPG